MLGPGRLVSWGLAEEGRPEPARTGAGDSRLRVLPCAALRPQRAIHSVLLLMLTSFFPDVAKLKVPRNPKRCPAPNASHGDMAGAVTTGGGRRLRTGGTDLPLTLGTRPCGRSVYYAKLLRQIAIKYIKLLNTYKSRVPNGSGEEKLAAAPVKPARAGQTGGAAPDPGGACQRGRAGARQGQSSREEP